MRIHAIVATTRLTRSTVANHAKRATGTTSSHSGLVAALGALLRVPGSSAPSDRPAAGRRTRAALCLGCLCALGFVAFLESASATLAADCPNAVFRTGPSAKLPECRAYELVSPPDTVGRAITALNASNFRDAFEFPLITAAGDSVIFNTAEGSLSGSPGSGLTDRYRSRRTPDGWVTEFIGPTAAETDRPAYGGVSADHQYYFLNAGLNNFWLEPEAILQAPFGGDDADYLRTPDGKFQLIASGSLGSAPDAIGRLITPGAAHVIFTSETQLEPEAPPTGVSAIYDRGLDGSAHVLSLLPGDVTPTKGAEYLGASPDGEDVAFRITYDQPIGSNDNSLSTVYVRHSRTTTKEVWRSNGVWTGKRLTCDPGTTSATLTYQWLRNGNPIAGATNATYTTAAADQGAVLQCQVTASSGEGGSLATSPQPLIAAPFVGKTPPDSTGSFQARITAGGLGVFSTEVGRELTCEPGQWEGNPGFTYRWLRNGVPIAGATGSTYTTVSADKGAALQCGLTAANADGAMVGTSAITMVNASPPTATANPTVSNETEPGGAPEEGDTLSCSAGTWTNGPALTYQWLRGGAPIPGATAATYTVAAEDQGKALQCGVSATNVDATTAAVSDQVVVEPQPGTAPPMRTAPGSVGGTARVGSTLFCSAGSWSGSPTFTYQWLRNGVEIAGATGTSYALAAADRDKMIQCRVTATNAGGSVVAINAGAGARYVNPAPPAAKASLPVPGVTFAGVFGGHVFFGDKAIPRSDLSGPSDLFSFNIADGSITRITDVEDAQFSHVSGDGSHVYFVSESQIGGEGEAGEPNLYVWSRSSNSTKLIATVARSDLKFDQQSIIGANLVAWTHALNANKDSTVGLALSNTRSTPDGSVFLFISAARLTAFDNSAAAPGICTTNATGAVDTEGRCPEVYLYDTNSEELSCVSCPQKPGPATGYAKLHSWGAVSELNPPNNLTTDGTTVFFETSEELVPEDTNGYTDVYRWKKGSGLALISTGEAKGTSSLYAVTPDGSDVAFLTRERLLPQDRNGGTPRLYDARVNGGFPPPEETVTEPCAGDACQGAPSAAPEAPRVASSSLHGSGNVRPELDCGKGKRRVVRRGKEVCVRRKRPRRHGLRRHAARREREVRR